MPWHGKAVYGLARQGRGGQRAAPFFKTRRGVGKREHGLSRGSPRDRRRFVLTDS